MPVNVALNKHASQSSLSDRSHPGEAARAVNGIKTGEFSFHTDLDDDPWWQVDLGQVYFLTSIVVYNRGAAGTELADRARNLIVRVSADGAAWETVHSGEQSFGGVLDNAPLVVPCHAARARFVHVQVQGRAYLHLDEVEVYAEEIPFLTVPLAALGGRYGTDKVSHGFCDIYEKLFSPVRLRVTKVLEIGVFFGASLKMWRDWFPHAVVHGADHFTGRQGNGHVFPKADTFLREVEAGLHPRIVLHTLDQSKRENVEEFRTAFLDGTFDIIIDDASHLMRDQQFSLAGLFRLLKPGGYFVIEDLHSSISPGYDVEADGSNSTLMMIQRALGGQGWTSKYMSREDMDFLDQTIDLSQCGVYRSGQSLTGVLRRRTGVQRDSAPAIVPGSVAVINYATSDGYHAALQQAHVAWAQNWISKSDVSADLVCFGPNVLDRDFAERNFSILKFKFGGGHWLWKPYIIASMLANTNAEFLVYCDCGAIFIRTLDEIIEVMRSTGAAVLGFNLTSTRENPRLEFMWTKGEVLRAMDATDPRFTHSEQIVATASVWRVCDESRALAAEWLRLMQDPVYATDLPSAGGEEAELFVRHRHDQSVFSILMKKLIARNSERSLLAVTTPFKDWAVGHFISNLIRDAHVQPSRHGRGQNG